MRRTFASVAKSFAGASLAQVGDLLSHASTDTTAGYAYLFSDERAALAQRTADAVDVLLAAPQSIVEAPRAGEGLAALADHENATSGPARGSDDT
jgi:hypothetical protein